MLLQQRHDQPRYAFLHIPKTGGASFEQILARELGDEFAVHPMHDYYCFPETLAERRIIAGHMPFALFGWERRPRIVLTILRSPIDRVISNYRYILMSPGHYGHDFVTRYRPSLTECLQHPALRFDMVNLQTRMLGWTPPPLGAALTGDSWAAFHRSCADYFDSDIDESCYRRAIAALQVSVRFGMYDDYENTVCRFCRLLGLSKPTRLPHLNRSNSEWAAITDNDLPRSAIAIGSIAAFTKRQSGSRKVRDMMESKVIGRSRMAAALRPPGRRKKRRQVMTAGAPPHHPSRHNH
jgi:hypothetical protein